MRHIRKGLKRTAYHEASHTVIAIRNGARVLSVSIRSTRAGAGSVETDWADVPEDQLSAAFLMYALAGGCGESLVCKHTNAMRWKMDCRMWEAEAHDLVHDLAEEDLTDAEEIKEHMRLLISNLRDRVSALLRTEEIRGDVEKIAAALLKYGTLTGAEVERLLRQ